MDDYEAQLTASLRGAVKDLLLGAAPLIPLLIAIVGLAKERRRHRKAMDHSLTVMEEVPGAVDSTAAQAEGLFRIQEALPEWARLEQDECGRWMVVDHSDQDQPVAIVAVIEAPAWAMRCSADELAEWGSRLNRFHR